MVGQFLHMRQNDNEQMASRVTFELEEQTASAVREEELRQEYAQAAGVLRTELSEEAAQRFQYLEHQQNIFAQARLRTVESALGCEYATAQKNLQQEYLTHVQGLHQELQTAQRQFEDSISRERASSGQELDNLRRELAEKSQLIREQANDLQQDEKLRREWQTNHDARIQEALAMQASQWKSHCEELTQHYDALVARDAERISEMERDLDDVSSKLIEASEKLEQWESWWSSDAQVAEPIERQQEVLGPIIEEERQQQPVTPIVMAPPTIPQEFLPPPLPPKFAHKNFPKRANESDESSHTGMDAQAIPTFAPTTPLSGHKPTQPSMTSAPSTPFGGPWAATREKLQSQNPCMDYNSCPGSGGISDASTLPMHPPPGMGFSPPSTPFAYANAMGTTSSSPPTGAPQGRIMNDEVRKDRSPLPKLVIKGGDATTLTRVINEWIQKTTISLNTWSQSAATFWAQVVGMARQRHNWWLSLSPDQRAMHIGLPTTGQTIPLQLPLLEATMRAELLNNVLPERVQTTSMQKGATTVLDLLFITFQTYLPSEPSARVEGLTTVEAPLRASKNFQEALTTLRSWRQQVITVVNDLGGNPEPLKLLSSLRTLISSLVSSDNAFATEVAQIFRTTQVKNNCTDQTLLQTMGMLEIELAARAQEDDEERRKRGQQTHHTANPAMGKAAGKGQSKEKKGAGKGKNEGSGDKPVCTDYLKDAGCPRGDKCTFRHPPRTGKCLRCGAVGHQLAQCRRPQRDQQKGSSSTSTSTSTPTSKARAKSKGAPRAKSKPPRKEQGNNTWVDDRESTVKIEEIPERTIHEDHSATYTESFAVNSQHPQVGTTTQRHLAKGVASNKGVTSENPNKAPILDTGATRCLLHLSWMSKDVIEKAERIHLGVANGTRSRALLWNNIMYSPVTARPLISVGQLKAMLDLRLVWDDGPPILLFSCSGIKYVLIRARVFHGLPIVSNEELKALIAAIEDFTVTGNLWSYSDWRAALDRDFEIFGDSIRKDHPQTIEEEDEMILEQQNPRVGMTRAVTSLTPEMGQAIDGVVSPNLTNKECNPLSGRTRQERRVHFDESADSIDGSAATNDATITLSGPESSNEAATTRNGSDEMSEIEAKDILLNHPLPKARQRTNIVSEDYVPEGRLFGAFTTRGEGITQATFRFPLAVMALMKLASTREGPCADEGFLSAQVNCGISLPVHKDKNNHGETWLIGLGDYKGGRLWIESPCGRHPPPVITKKWQESLRGDLVDVRDRWYRFDPRCYHAVEPVMGGRRVSVALFSPRAWKRIPPHALCELQDLGFFPPRSAGAMMLDLPEIDGTQGETSQADSTISGDLRDIPQVGSKDLGDIPQVGPRTLRDFWESSSKDQAMPAEEMIERSEDDKEEDLKASIPIADAELQEWCLLPEVALPFAHLDASDGSISPLDRDSMEELKQHIQSGHLTKSHLCKGCLTAEGPRRIHRRVRDVDKATHTLHIDIAGPLTKSEDGYVYFSGRCFETPRFSSHD